jgi:hypothetical protein
MKFQVIYNDHQIGRKGPRIVSEHQDKHEAQQKARRLNALLSPGDKNYYGARYRVQLSKENEQ